MTTSKIVIKNIVSVDNLVSMIAEQLFIKHIKPFLSKNEVKTELIYFTRKETASKLKCSLATLNLRVNEGMIKSTKFGGKVLFSNLDIENSLIKLSNQK